MKLSDVASLTGGELIGNPDLDITRIVPLQNPVEGGISFAENESALASIKASDFTAVLIPPAFKDQYSKDCIVVGNPRVAIAQLSKHFTREPVPQTGIHPTAVIGERCEIDPSAYIGPNCSIGNDVFVGANTIVHCGTSILNGSKIGQDSILFHNTSIYHDCEIGNRVRIHAGTVVGSDGFGYVMDKGKHLKIHQLGSVVIEDDVEIGANCTIDRGALGVTKIGEGTKIDNLVQIAHNVEIGAHSVLVAQVGVAGSSKLGKYVVAAGQAGISGHLKIGNQVTIAGQSGVTRDLKDGETVMGTPAIDHIQFKKASVVIAKLPELYRKLRKFLS